MYNIFQLTGAYRPIASVSSVARAGVNSLQTLINTKVLNRPVIRSQMCVQGAF